MSQPPLAAWAQLDGLPFRPLPGGLINDTFVVGEPPAGVVQRLNPIFRPEVNLDIAAITSHVAARGLVTPRLIPTSTGWWTIDDDGACWRALSWVPGVTWHKLQAPEQAAAAGRLVARWHNATADLDHTFAFCRPGAHDTVAHMEKLARVLGEHRSHRLYDRAASLGARLLEAWRTWSGRLDLPVRIAHGDLKVSNLRFTEAGEGICLLDLDTMGWLSLDVELGDAWRSWCNPASEDAAETVFSLPMFEASAKAYLEETAVAAEVRESLPGGIERICLELASRFCADALEETYFGWSSDVAPSRGDHNLLRASGQLALAASVREQRGQLDTVLR